MDADQFNKFMALQQKIFDKISQKNDSASTSATSNATSTILQTFESFDAKKESFKYYRQRFEKFLEMKKILSNKAASAQILLNSIGLENYNILAALVAPKVPAKLGYDDLMTAFETYLCPKKNVLVYQHEFLSRYQKENESIAEYVAALRRNIIDCEFTCKCKESIADIFLRSQFVRGIRDGTIREKILQSTDSTFEDIAKTAIILEASKINNQQIANNNYGSNSSNSSNSEINKISKYHSSRKDSRQFNRDKGKFFNSNSDVTNSKSNSRYHSKSNSRINYEKLGISNLCLRCGRDNHMVKDCRSNRNALKCNACKKTGHVRKVCLQTLLTEKGRNKINQNSNSNDVSNIEEWSQYGVNQIVDVFQHQKKDQDKYYATVKIENQPQKFEVDSGAGFTFMPRDQFNKLNISTQLQSSNIAFRSYTGNIFRPDGKVQVNVQYKDKNSIEELYIVPEEYVALIGRTWIRHLNICLQEIDLQHFEDVKIQQIQLINNIDDIISKYPELFSEKVGCVQKFKVALKLRDNSKPIFYKEREVPYALREKVEKELDMLESTGIITKVSTSDWGSPLVVIPKADGSVRLCVDYKMGVNARLVNANYPIRPIIDILNSLRNSKYFCRLDLFKAYLHIQVDEESSEIQTLSTHRGTYRMNRLSFGIKTAPSEFNRIIDQILQGLPKTLSYFDDIIIHGSTLPECEGNLLLCLERLKQHDLHLNKNKCSFYQEKIEYLGHTVELNKISKSSTKVQAIIDMPRPENVEGVRRFLGMVTYYSRFLPNNSTMTYPLRQLIRKDYKFKWSTACEAAFIKLKNEIASDRTLTIYDPKLPVVVSCDASPVGVAGILSHSIDGEERPVAFTSRSLTSAEQNYSQLDREALAIVFTINQFFNYLYGKHFKLVTDNKALTRIFHSNSKIPPLTSGRLLRYAVFLAAFDYEVVFKKGVENIDADCLSRASITQNNSSQDMLINNEINKICLASVNVISTECVTAETIRQETRTDKNLSEIVQQIQNDSDMSYEYTYEGGILFKGQRVVIPKSLQQKILNEVHRTHIGITKMKQLARRYVFWKGIDKDIERLSRTCEPCAKIKSNPPKVEIHPWEEPNENWDRIHIDYAGPCQNHYFLIVMDAKSKWAEIKLCKNAPTSESTIELLSDIFSTHGYPRIMVSDNATIFVSDQFKTYLEENGIIQKLIAPNYPATNGLAERNVQTLKHRLIAMENETLSMKHKIREILFKYRTTPLANNKTPAEIYLKRNVRIRLDAIRPTKHSQNSQHNFKVRELSVGERVQVRCYQNNKQIWKLGSIIKKWGQLHYQIKLDNGYIFKRHINQLRKTEIPKKKVTFAIPEKEQIKQTTKKNQPYFMIIENQTSNSTLHESSNSSLQESSNSNLQEKSNSNASNLNRQPSSNTSKENVQSTSGHQQNINIKANHNDVITKRTSNRERKPPNYYRDFV